MRLACLLILFLPGCSLHSSGIPSEPDGIVFDVTNPAPEFIPEWHFRGKYRTCNSPAVTGCFSNNVLMVRFRPGATEAQREYALSLVRGEVVGGLPGMYLIRVPISDPRHDVFRAADLLRALDYVAYAHPDFDLLAMLPSQG
jgi:hypothetical protein